MQFQSRRGSLSFGSAEAAKFYASTPHDCAVDAVANTPRIFSAYLKIERPVIASLTDPFIELGQLGAMIGEGFLNELAVDFSEDITYTSQWVERFSEYKSPAHLAKCDAQSFKSLYFACYAILDSQKWIERLKLSGFDGAIHCGSGVTACEAEYKVFSPDQAWIIARQRIDAR